MKIGTQICVQKTVHHTIRVLKLTYREVCLGLFLCVAVVVSQQRPIYHINQMFITGCIYTQRQPHAKAAANIKHTCKNPPPVFSTLSCPWSLPKYRLYSGLHSWPNKYNKHLKSPCGWKDDRPCLVMRTHQLNCMFWAAGKERRKDHRWAYCLHCKTARWWHHPFWWDHRPVVYVVW